MPSLFTDLTLVTITTVVIIRLAAHHNRDGFDCGELVLNDFLHRFAGQYSRTDFGRTYVAVASNDDPKILGYYTIAVSSVPLDLIEGNLPRHSVPVIHLGRLATDISTQGLGVGQMLLMHAFQTSATLSEIVGIHAVEVVALNESARNFYLKFGFTPLKSNPLHLYLPVKKIRQMNL